MSAAVRRAKTLLKRPYLIRAMFVRVDRLLGHPGAHVDQVDLDAFNGWRNFSAEEESGAGVEENGVLPSGTNQIKPFLALRVKLVE